MSLRRVLLFLAAAVGVLLTIVAVRTATMHPRPRGAAALPPLPVRAGAAERLAAAVRIRTVSQDTGAPDLAAFAALHEELARSFPLVHQKLQREVVAGASLLFTWSGRDPKLPPVVLLAHQDVVPAEEDAAWTHAPFSGDIADGFVWGRGTLDDKVGVLGILEAVETLLARGVVPARTIILAFGHDEEVGGTGAAAMAALLKTRGVAPLLVFDEGMVIAEGMMAGLERPAALIGIAEKGSASLELTTGIAGGHSSMPSRESAIGVLARAVTALETNQMPAHLEGAPKELLSRLAPEMPLLQRALLGNLWLTGPVVSRVLQRSPTTNALLRTTTALTVIEAGDKENVLPFTARAVVNFRLRPGDRIADVVAHAQRVIADDRVKVALFGGHGNEASPTSPTDSAGYRLIEDTVSAVFPDVVPAPTLVIGGTDARHYVGLTSSVYRFLPVPFRPDDLGRLHGRDERIAVSDYEKAVQFYARFLERAVQ